MEIKTLLKSNLKSHRGTVLGVLVLIFLVSLSLGTVLTVWLNSSRYVNSEIDRLGYGDLTVWVSGLSDAAPLAEEISALNEVESVGVQSLIFSEYEIRDQESDSEGQLITYEPERYPYKFLSMICPAMVTLPRRSRREKYMYPLLWPPCLALRSGTPLPFPLHAAEEI